MNCEQGLLLINARMDGALPPDDRHRLTAHLSQCADCQMAADELERTDRELARAFSNRPRAASAIADRALEAWFAEAPLPARRRVHLGWMAAAAAVFAVAFLLYGPGRWDGSSGGDEGERVRALVTEWRQSDAPQDVELRLRSLGSACAAPLADAVQTWEGEASDACRLGAARVLCDLADTPQIPALIELLGDTSYEIQTLSEASLVRLTGRRRVEPGAAAQPDATCSTPQGDWREWWNRNRERFERSGR